MIRFGDGFILEEGEELGDADLARIMTPENVEAAHRELDRLHAVRDSLTEYNGQTAYSDLLMPCPFCGGRAWVQIRSRGYGADARVVCGGCHVSTSDDYVSGRTVSLLDGEDVTELLAIEKAIATWNRRDGEPERSPNVRDVRRTFGDGEGVRGDATGEDRNDGGERRRVAATLVEYTKTNIPCHLANAVQCALGNVGDYNKIVRLAELIDPTCEARPDVFVTPANSGLPESEQTVYRCSACGEILTWDEDFDPRTDSPAYCGACGARVTWKGEPWGA